MTGKKWKVRYRSVLAVVAVSHVSQVENKANFPSLFRVDGAPGSS